MLLAQPRIGDRRTANEMEVPRPSLPAIRCLTKRQAATYLGIGVTLLTELGIPFLNLGRRCVYDRVDLDGWLEEYKRRGRVRKASFMARENGLYRRRDSCFWWVDVVLPNGRRVCGSTKTESRKEAEAFVSRLKREAYEQGALGVRPPRRWQEAVVRYLSVKANLRSIEDVAHLPEA